MENVVVFGGPGAGAMVAQTIRRLAANGTPIGVSGFLNDFAPIGSTVGGAPILGPFNAWRERGENATFIAPLHAAKVMQSRVKRILGLDIPQARWATIIDPMALVADDAVIMSGSYVGPLAVVDASARLGRNGALWPGSQIGHDIVVEDFVSVGRGSVLSGRCRIATGTYIGAGAVVADGLQLGRYSVVGAGAVVIRDVPAHAIVAGNPARIVGNLNPDDDPVAR